MKSEVVVDEALSRRGRGSKRKGANYERKIKKHLFEGLGIELQRTPLSGGFAKDKNLKAVKGDLNTLDDSVDFKLHVECKDQKTWSIKAWWRQTREECPKGKIPSLFMHMSQEVVDGKRVNLAEDFVLLRLEDFLKLVDVDKVIDRKGVE